MVLDGMDHSRDQVVEYKNITDQNKIEQVQQLFQEYAESLGIDLCFQNFDAELQSLPGKYGPPDGKLILVLVDSLAAGCIALRRLSDDICEMKRLYVRQPFQGLGIGKKLIRIIINEAIQSGYRYIRLDTLPTMEKAQNLYSSFGFYDIEPYVYNPISGTRFMELKLEEY